MSLRAKRGNPAYLNDLCNILAVLDFFHARKVSPSGICPAGSISSLSGINAVQKSARLLRRPSYWTPRNDKNVNNLITYSPNHLITFKKAAFTLAEGATHVGTRNSSRKVAFTLAEVLITLGIIGVVAAISLPTVITNVNERRNSEREANIAQKMTQAMEHMRALGKLTPYATTEDFVNELKNHIKINKICYKDNIADCWPTDKIIDGSGEEYEVSNAKTGKMLGKEAVTTNNVGLILADGASIILNYDNRTKGYDVGDEVRGRNENLPVGGGNRKSFPYTTDVTDAISFVMDVNGKNKPNRESVTEGKYYDIRSFRGARFSYDIPWEEGDAGKVLYIGYISQSQTVDCRSSNRDNSDYKKYCGDDPSGYHDDYWAGAQKACKEATYGKGSLPTVSKLQEIFSKRSQYPSLKGGWFWSSDEYSKTFASYVSDTSSVSERNKESTFPAILCVAD